jgi:hypothetical protein
MHFSQQSGTLNTRCCINTQKVQFFIVKFPHDLLSAMDLYLDRFISKRYAPKAHLDQRRTVQLHTNGIQVAEYFVYRGRVEIWKGKKDFSKGVQTDGKVETGGPVLTPGRVTTETGTSFRSGRRTS